MSTVEQSGSVPIEEVPLDAPETPLAPASQGERIGSLDFIRGIAVMGILVANIVAFGQPFQAYMYPDAFLSEHGPVSDWLLVAQFVLIDGKMRALFTLLFGAGLYLFMERAWQRGATRWLQARRLFFLILFGMIHFYLIWMGDILFYYAVIGFAIVGCLKWSAKAQLWTALIGYVFGALLYAAMLSVPYFVAETSIGEGEQMAPMRADLDQGKAEALADGARETALVESGDYAGFVMNRVTEDWFEPLVNVFFVGFELLPLMLLGVALYRLGFFSGSFSSRKMRMWGWIGLIVGAVWHLALVLWAKQDGYTYYGLLAVFVGWSPIPRLMMGLALAALLVEYSQGWTGWLAQRVSAAGRAAFTNYLGTSIVMLFVFHGWALGLFGQLNRPQLYLVTILTCIVMLAWSKPWLERYRYGPLEWLWRCLTYGKLFPLKR
ncbi:MAG: DUF418 domain-containing protein [Erythrobacter sp.]|nr:DUF418 domain-containing protein [Erythrobacter sp.]